jgi:photosystem I reaction center subunit XII
MIECFIIFLRIIETYFTENIIMISDTQIFVALLLALVSLALAIRLGTALYQ